ncbi:methionine ABC transporter ATP-binding protein [Curtobacterium sp. BRB10]|uniref:methionine ABC transporter ATP-binding protein n=1 Tax=Curtobacterium sp. BRB10 TaxID=2962579 RepID=UPI002881049D|nr:methionine ABC transporter ATP-binding protein [Curtobacterium sp. BRB10]MDT0234795.1 methionine ABC transporter ATP-binding protein [Curtobacterium sp. BRB10]
MLEVRDVSKTYRRHGREVTALDHVSLSVPDGGITGIAGRSGAGKSTLFRVVTALLRPDSGSVHIDGEDLFRLRRRDLRARRRRIGIVFQQFNLLHGRTAAENVELPLLLAGTDRTERRRRVGELLDLVGLADRADNHPSQLSGGQKQRVGIARALATNPSVLLSDEATSALDTETTEQVLGLLERVNRELGVSVVLITHELEILRNHAHEVVAFEAGRVVEQGRTIDLVSDPTSRIGRAMLPRATSATPATGTPDAPRASRPGADRPRVLVTVRGEATARGYLSRLAADTAYDVLSGGVHTVGGEQVARYELELPDRAGLDAVRRTADGRTAVESA